MNVKEGNAISSVQNFTSHTSQSIMAKPFLSSFQVEVPEAGSQIKIVYLSSLSAGRNE